MDLFLKFMRLDWWVYIIVVVSFFSVAMVLNYVVKKINEARLEERFVKIQNKASNNQSIQVQRRAESRLIPRVPLEIVLEQSNPPTVKGISLVFDQNESNDRNNDRIDIKNFPKSQNLTTADVTDVSDGNDVTGKPSENEIVPPAFLGKIYNELSLMERSKSLSSTDKDNVKDEIAGALDFKKQESKSTPSVKKVLDNQHKEDFRKWPKVVVENIVSDPNPITSPSLQV